MYCILKDTGFGNRLEYWCIDAFWIAPKECATRFASREAAEAFIARELRDQDQSALHVLPSAY